MPWVLPRRGKWCSKIDYNLKVLEEGIITLNSTILTFDACRKREMKTIGSFFGKKTEAATGRVL